MAEEMNESRDEDFGEIDETLDTDWKSETLKLREKAIRQRETTKSLRTALKEKEAKLSEFEKNLEKGKEPSEFDYGQKAFLKASGINGADELALVKEHQKLVGDNTPLDDLIDNPYFKQKLESLRTSKANKDAIDSSNRSGSPSSKTDVNYWLAKGEHPPRELGKKLAEEYVDARRKQLTTDKMFYND